MRQDIRELKQMKDRIASLEVDLSICQKNIEKYERDLRYLYSSKSTLSHNLQLLKNEQIVTTMVEYSKLTDELEYVTNKILIYEARLKRHLKEKQGLVESIDKLNKNFKTFYHVVSNTRTVINFNNAKRKIQSEKQRRD